MAKASHGQAPVYQPQEAMGHEKIGVIISVLEDQQTLRFIVLCTPEKLCVTPMYRFRVSRGLYSGLPINQRKLLSRKNEFY
jgi:hypothetical protein